MKRSGRRERRAQGDEEVVGVVVERRDERPRPHETGLFEDPVLACVADEHGESASAEPGRVEVDDDQLGVPRR